MGERLNFREWRLRLWIACLFCIWGKSPNGNIFPVIGPLCEEFTGHRWLPSQTQWRRALMFSLIFSWITGWVYNGEAGGLRSHRAHHDVIVMHQHLNDLTCFTVTTNCWSWPFFLSSVRLFNHTSIILHLTFPTILAASSHSSDLPVPIFYKTIGKWVYSACLAMSDHLPM